MRELVGIRQQITDLEACETEIENKLKRLIGDRDGIDGPWGRISWRYSKPSTAWKEVAMALGARERADLAAKHVGKASRRFNVTINEEAATRAA